MVKFKVPGGNITIVVSVITSEGFQVPVYQLHLFTDLRRSILYTRTTDVADKAVFLKLNEDGNAECNRR